MSTSPLPMASPVPAPPHGDPRRPVLVRRARQLAWFGIAWHFVEAAIAVLAGMAASSIALIGFGADSLIEALAGFVVVWRFTSARADDPQAERRAQQLIAASFAILAVYVATESARSLIGGTHANVSWIGIVLAAVTASTMPLLARAKQRLGRQLGSSATASEGAQSMLCAYLSLALLVGLGANALVGWWWLDSIAALAIAGVAAREARSSWRGEDCCTTPLAVDGDSTCHDDCC
jgi:divalent metal cation (Fe/Co/Zn/Cd) transporter